MFIYRKKSSSKLCSCCIYLVTWSLAPCKSARQILICSCWSLDSSKLPLRKKNTIFYIKLSLNELPWHHRHSSLFFKQWSEYFFHSKNEPGQAGSSSHIRLCYFIIETMSISSMTVGSEDQSRLDTIYWTNLNLLRIFNVSNQKG